MAELLLLTAADGPELVLPALGLLAHRVRVAGPEPAALVHAPEADVVLVDARTDLAAARATCRLLRATGLTLPLVLVLTEGGLTVVTPEWGVTDVVLAGASPAEVEARLRLAVGGDGPAPGSAEPAGDRVTAGDLTIDGDAWTVRLRGRPLDLTYKEFELLRHLAQHPGRVFTRERLLQEVWGYDYYGGSRTVDVHVRRLRAKLGPEHEHLIGTVRNVGYRFDARGGPDTEAPPAADTPTARPGTPATTAPTTATDVTADPGRAPAARRR